MTQNIYVDIDALLDTRFGSVIMLDRRMDTNYASKLITANYSQRQTDKLSVLLPEFPNDMFIECYETRTVETLKVSRMTNIVPILKDLVSELGDTSRYLPDTPNVGITVNIYPYTLSVEERMTFKDIISFYINNVTVTIIDKPPIGLMPSVIDANYAAVFLYHFDDWLTLHNKALMDNKLPEVLFFGPRLFIGDIPTQHDLQEVYSSDIPMEIDPFKASEMALSEYISLRFIAPAAFSFIGA